MRSVAELILLMIFIENDKNKKIILFIVLKGRMYPIGSIRVLTDLSDTASKEINLDNLLCFPLSYASL